MERRDASKHPTFLRCSNTCSFTLQIPTILEANNKCNNNNYTITLELRFEKLPLIGNLQSLLRFSIPDITHARKIHRTSVYINGDGIVVGRPIERNGSISDDINPSSDQSNMVNNKNNGSDNSTAIDDATTSAIADNTTKTMDNLNDVKSDEINIVASKINENNDRDDSASAEVIGKSLNKVNVKTNAVRIRAGIWSIVSVVVNPLAGILESYIDGKV